MQELVRISGDTFKVPITKQYIDSMSDRLVNMREDSLYTRLKETPNDKFRPDDKYWEKRYKSYSQTLDEILKNIKD